MAAGLLGLTRSAQITAVAAASVLVAGLLVVTARQSDSATTFAEDAAVESFRDRSLATTPAPSAAVASSAPTPAARPAGSAKTAAPTRAPARKQEAAQAKVRPSPSSAGAPVGPVAAPDARPSAGSAAATPSTSVEPGVYRYATEGFEAVDALGGARHDYPATTTVTYTRRDCGTEERWQPLRERVGVAVTCPGAVASEVRSTFQQREFFGRQESKRYRCEPGLMLLPRSPQPGQDWRGTCTSGDSTATFAGKVVTLEDLDVEGRRVPVVRIQLVAKLTGSTRGRSSREVWLRRTDGLLVQAVGETDTTADTEVGPVQYRESYQLRLRSLTPRT